MAHAVEYLVFDHAEDWQGKRASFLALEEESAIRQGVNIARLRLILRVLHLLGHLEELLLLLRRLEQVLVHGGIGFFVDHSFIIET